MACTLTTGRGIDCRDAIGGIQGVYVYCDSSDVPTVLGDADVTIASSEITDTSITDAKAYKIDLVKNSGSFTQTIEGSAENGTFFYSHSVEITLHKADHQTQDFIDKLARNRFTLLVHDNNDNVYAVGFNKGIELTGGQVTTGGALGDLHGATLTFEAQTMEPAPMLARTAGAGTSNYPLDGTTQDLAAVNATLITPEFA